jgi:DNA-binding PadR family transcriptional regulator
VARRRNISAQTLAVLAVFQHKPAEWLYGYELSRLTGLGSGTLYPLLMRLHQQGLLEAMWLEAQRPGRPPRHGYRLTPDGAALARESQPSPKLALQPKERPA